jgi:hypothetical protein
MSSYAIFDHDNKYSTCFIRWEKINQSYLIYSLKSLLESYKMATPLIVPHAYITYMGNEKVMRSASTSQLRTIRDCNFNVFDCKHDRRMSFNLSADLSSDALTSCGRYPQCFAKTWANVVLPRHCMMREWLTNHHLIFMNVVIQSNTQN